MQLVEIVSDLWVNPDDIAAVAPSSPVFDKESTIIVLKSGKEITVQSMLVGDVVDTLRELVDG